MLSAESQTFIVLSYIGLSAAVLLIWSGEIMGASNLVSSVLLRPKKALTDPCMAWKMIFLSIFLLLSNLALAPFFTDDERLGNDPSIPVVSIYGYILGGFFVGFGTRLGNGCTTGHGICGMARLSKRSIVAVATFMGSAFATAQVMAPDNNLFANGTAWLRTDTAPVLYNPWLGLSVSMILVVPTICAIYNLFFVKKDEAVDTVETTLEMNKDLEASELNSDADQSTPYGTLEKKDAEGSTSTVEASSVPCESEDECDEKDNVRKVFTAFVSSCLFATGLAVSGMVLPSKISGFLILFTIPKGTYDPTLLTVMIGGCIVSMLSYQFIKPFSLIFNKDSTHPLALERPLIGSKFSIPCIQTIDMHLVGGAFCFGIGWGLSNLCPGP
jgi:uncharacterized protein